MCSTADIVNRFKFPFVLNMQTLHPSPVPFLKVLHDYATNKSYVKLTPYRPGQAIRAAGD
jgi:hypothetical protein